MTEEYAVEVLDTSKTYDHSSEGPIEAVRDVSFHVSSGERVGLLGPNGAGKTTILKMIMGLVKPTTGTLRINGYDVQNQSRRARSDIAAVLEGNRNFYWRLTVLENMEFFAGINRIDARERRAHHLEILEYFGLADKADELVKNLSRGMQQKTAIACALAKEAPILMLDEPTLGLDVEASYDFRSDQGEFVSNDRTVLITSHDMDVIEDLCERVIIINDGEIVLEESVETVTSLFDNTSVAVALESKCADRVKPALDHHFDVVEWDEGIREVTFEVVLDEKRALFELMDLLRKREAVPRSVRAGEVDLESAFLRVLESNGRVELQA